jgi:hypothetical protein
MAGKRKIVVGGPSMFPAGKLFAGDLAAERACQGEHQFIAPCFRGRIDRPVIVGRDDAAGFRLRHGYALSSLERTNLNASASLAQELLQQTEKPCGHSEELLIPA